MKNKPLITAAVLLAATAGSANAESTAERIDRLEQEIQLLKRQNEITEEKAEAAAAKAANVEFGNKGLVITSPDKKGQIALNALIQADFRNYISDEDKNLKSEFTARRLRPILTGKYGNASFRLMPDFVGDSTRIFDAHIDYKFIDELQFRIGKFKPPVSLERLQSAADTFFIERGDANNLAPNRDIGAQIYGELIPGQLEYQFAVMNGNEDLGNTNSDIDDEKDFIARVFAHPFAESEIVDLQGLGVGVAGSVGRRDGSTTNRGLPQYKTFGQNNVFTYNAASFADGTKWRVYPQAYWFSGNIGVIGEYAYTSEEVTNAGAHEELEHDAWNIAASYVLTGEDVNFKGAVKPAEEFDLGGNGWGAFELVGRYGETNFDKDAFPIFASLATSASSQQSFGIGLNWYLNQSTKFMLDLNHTTFEGGAAGGADRGDENALFSRVQYKF